MQVVLTDLVIFCVFHRCPTAAPFLFQDPGHRIVFGHHFSSSSSGLTVTQSSGFLTTLLKILVKYFIECLSVLVCLVFSYDWTGVIHLWQECLFCSPGLLSNGDGGISTLVLWGWLNTAHKIHHSLLVPFTHSLVEGNIAGQVVPHRCCPVEESA